MCGRSEMVQAHGQSVGLKIEESDLRIELALSGVHRLYRVRKGFRSILSQAVQIVVLPHVRVEVFLRPTGPTSTPPERCNRPGSGCSTARSGGRSPTACAPGVPTVHGTASIPARPVSGSSLHHLPAAHSELLISRKRTLTQLWNDVPDRTRFLISYPAFLAKMGFRILVANNG